MKFLVSSRLNTNVDTKNLLRSNVSKLFDMTSVSCLEKKYTQK